jgi:hypothetical protein
MSKPSIPRIPPDLAALLEEVNAEVQRLERTGFWSKLEQLRKAADVLPLGPKAIIEQATLRLSLSGVEPRSQRWGPRRSARVLQHHQSPSGEEAAAEPAPLPANVVPMRAAKEAK